ncbi:MAG TPA: ABC transporter permease [Thermoanaerobaculia bacterium]|nr:ABC transporter permease [Thermoanaerobaculia bacterium]
MIDRVAGRVPGRRLFRFPWRTAIQVAVDVDDELQFHLDKMTQELAEEGWPPEAARVEAVRRFGDLEATRKACCALDRGKETQMRWKQALEALGQDVRFAARQLWKSPGLAALIVLTLALGVGASTAIFSVVDGVLLQPLPYPQPDRLVRVFPVYKDGNKDVFSIPNFIDWSTASRTITAAAAVNTGTVNLSGGDGEPERLQGAFVGSPFFSILGIRPLAGRWFAPGEDKPDAPRVAVISEDLWQRRFSRDRAALGRVVELNGEPYAVVGVVAHNDELPGRTDVWLPLVFSGGQAKSRGAYFLDVLARLAPGATLEKAQAEAAVIGKRLETQYPEANAGYGLSAAPLHEMMVGNLRVPLLVLLGAVLAVLLIACVNVANLLLVRASAREGEVAVRTALGAGRGRIVRQLLTESLVLALAGGAAGVGLAFWITKGLVALAPPQTPRLGEIGLHAPVLLFALAITLLTGVLFGLAPALQASRPDLVTALKEGARGSRGRAATRARNVLVIAEVALAVVLLAGAGLLLRSFARLQDVDLGFRPQQAVTFRLALPDTHYKEDPKITAFVDRLLEKVQHLPGVTSAGVGAYAMPLNNSNFTLSFSVEGRPPAPPGQEDVARVGVVTPDFFRTLGVPLQRGRVFNENDRPGAPQVVLLNAAAAHRFFPGEDPLGKRVKLGWSQNGNRRGGEVVGIVGDFRQGGLDKAAEPQMFLPYGQAPLSSLWVVVRTAADPAAVSAVARSEVRQVDATLPLFGLQTLTDLVAGSASQAKFYLLLLGGFAAMALLLAAIGIYGVIAYAVRQRTQEIGIRMALGASRDRVQGMVVRQGLTLACLGALAGLLAALFATRWMKSLLYEIGTTDPIIYLAVPLLLVAVAALASWVPARRAARTEPQLALRGEG